VHLDLLLLYSIALYWAVLHRSVSVLERAALTISYAPCLMCCFHFQIPARAALVGQRLFVFGGLPCANAPPLATLQVLDLATMEWEGHRADLPGCQSAAQSGSNLEAVVQECSSSAALPQHGASGRVSVSLRGPGQPAGVWDLWRLDPLSVPGTASAFLPPNCPNNPPPPRHLVMLGLASQ